MSKVVIKSWKKQIDQSSNQTLGIHSSNTLRMVSTDRFARRRHYSIIVGGQNYYKWKNE
jgi:hypothetical protein